MTKKRNTDRTGSSADTGSAAQTAQGSADSQAPSGEVVEFSIETGQNSSVVGDNLYRAGLVDDATSFDRYLEQNNYDNILQNGTFSIQKGSTYEEIAKILTRQQ
ncbi:MAG: endolytic transglycosylase MltG [Lachnospiraceae bacterium]|nr:endolytic transglycosylase MltG [Lachnospiraceae bacterium]